jgi:hypothetical protein
VLFARPTPPPSALRAEGQPRIAGLKVWFYCVGNTQGYAMWVITVKVPTLPDRQQSILLRQTSPPMGT